MKDSFILYNSFYEPIKTLSDEQLGRLFRAIFNYTINKETTNEKDIKIAFLFIKNQLDMDIEKWEETRKKRSEAGKNHKGNQYSKMEQMEQVFQNGSVNENDNENVNVNVNDNENNKKKNKKEKFYKDTELNDLFNEFLQLRKKLKAVNSDRAIKLLQNQLSNYDDATKKEMINQSIVNSWKSVYELKQTKQKKESLQDKLRREIKEAEEEERNSNEEN